MKVEAQDYFEDEMPWEFEARNAIFRAIENCEKDEIRGHIYLWSGEDHRANLIKRIPLGLSRGLPIDFVFGFAVTRSVNFSAKYPVCLHRG